MGQFRCHNEFGLHRSIVFINDKFKFDGPSLVSSICLLKCNFLLRVNVRVDANGNPIGNLTELFGAFRAPAKVSPIAILPATFLMFEFTKIPTPCPIFFRDQGVEHPWYQGLTDYGFGLSGADGNEIQSEYIVPYEMAVPALQAVYYFFY